MDHKDLRTLHLLEEIESGKISSQRHVAKKLNVSLGLANSFIKRLANIGYCKITTIPKNRIKYILTPKGAAEKTRLTYEYIHYSYKFYKRARQNLKELFKNLVGEGVQRIVFYGADELAEIAYVSLQETALELTAVVDDKKVGKKFFKFKITGLNRIKSLSFDKIIITDTESNKQIMEKLMDGGIPRSKLTLLE